MSIIWKDFYSQIKSATWPECKTFKDLMNLPVHIQQEIFFLHLSYLFEEKQFVDQNVFDDVPLLVLAKTASEVKQLCDKPDYDYYSDQRYFLLSEEVYFGNIKISYHPSMDGGGIKKAPMFAKILSMVSPNKIFEHCLEWCSGPGFIGFNILSQGLCKKLDLADIWKPSLQAAKTAVHLHEVNTHHIRRLIDIPQTQYDLIVGNPPWRPQNLLGDFGSSDLRLICDPGLQTCKEFFEDVSNYLRQDGMIVLCQGKLFTGPADFVEMVDQAGLQITHVLSTDAKDSPEWFMIIQHRDS